MGMVKRVWSRPVTYIFIICFITLLHADTFAGGTAGKAGSVSFEALNPLYLLGAHSIKPVR